MYYVYIRKHPIEDRIYIGFQHGPASAGEETSKCSPWLAAGLLRSLRFGKGCEDEGTAAEAVRQLAAAAEKTNHGQFQCGLK